MKQSKKRIWDVPTRLFHWLLMISVAYAWFAVEILEDMEQHFYAGYTVLVLVLFRLIWGFCGTRYAKFSSFIVKPSAIIDAARNIFDRKARAYAGHSPLGSLSVIALLGLLTAQVTTGLFSNDEYYFGPLSEHVSSSLSSRFTEIHDLNFGILKILIFVHIAAVLYYELYKKDRLIIAMLSGNKVDRDNTFIAIDSSRLYRAIAVVSLCIVAVLLLINL